MRMNHPNARAASRMLLFPAMLLFFAGNAPAATIEYNLSSIGSNYYRYSFIFGAMQLNANQEVEIRFDPAIYLNLTNGIADSDFNVTLLQPNNPPGTFGDYTALALVNNASLAGPFSVDVQFVHGIQAGGQSFVINQLDQSGRFVSTIQSGFTTTAASQVPEPASGFLAGAAALLGAIAVARRRVRRAT